MLNWLKEEADRCSKSGYSDATVPLAVLEQIVKRLEQMENESELVGVEAKIERAKMCLELMKEQVHNFNESTGMKRVIEHEDSLSRAARKAFCRVVQVEPLLKKILDDLKFYKESQHETDSV